MKAHTIPADEEKRLLKDLRDDISIINRTRSDTDRLGLALSGKLLKDTVKQINSDYAKDRIKIRKYDSVKFKFKNYTKGIAGITMDFVDRGYYIDKDTKKSISKPSNQSKRLILALRKEKGRWKIFELYSTVLKKKK